MMLTLQNGWCNSLHILEEEELNLCRRRKRERIMFHKIRWTVGGEGLHINTKYDTRKRTDYHTCSVG